MFQSSGLNAYMKFWPAQLKLQDKETNLHNYCVISNQLKVNFIFTILIRQVQSGNSAQLAFCVQSTISNSVWLQSLMHNSYHNRPHEMSLRRNFADALTTIKHLLPASYPHEITSAKQASEAECRENRSYLCKRIGLVQRMK